MSSVDLGNGAEVSEALGRERLQTRRQDTCCVLAEARDWERLRLASCRGEPWEEARAGRTLCKGRGSWPTGSRSLFYCGKVLWGVLEGVLQGSMPVRGTLASVEHRLPETSGCRVFGSLQLRSPLTDLHDHLLKRPEWLPQVPEVYSPVLG